ncbi:branched-chain amino acid ABC transporter permease [Microbacterium sp. KHB019]|jgi:branched-chain amino acid transport system permease protein|uniref:branched-chain amino acid ABC transporter permease n=1 Tax=Microbacterium sp. KHB019 TaxID=3129770 RepID=UPI00307B0748
MNISLLPDVIAGSIVLAGIYLLIALSWVIIYRASKLWNFATGQFLVLAGFMAATLIAWGVNYWVASLVVVVVMAACGVLMYRFLLRPLTGQEMYAPFIVTLGVGIVIQGLIPMIWGPNNLPLPAPFPSATLGLPFGITLTVNDLIIPILAFTVWVGLLAFLRWTKVGGQMRAANESTILASQSGMNVWLLFGLAFAIAFGALALAGIASGQRSLVALSAIPLGLKGLVPAMLGGLSSVGGAAVGALIVAIVESMVVLYLGADWSNLVVFAILLVVLALRPQGLFGRAEAARV